MSVIAETLQRRIQPLAGHAVDHTYGAAHYLADRAVGTVQRAREYREGFAVSTIEPWVESALFALKNEEHQASEARFWGNVSEKGRLYLAGNQTYKNIKIGAAAAGGGMAGSAQAKMLKTLHDYSEVLPVLDLVDVFNAVSCGAANVTSAYGGSVENGSDVYVNKLSGRRFITHDQRWPGGMHLEVLGAHLRSPEGMTPTTLKKAQTEIQVGVVKANGEQVLFDAREQSGPEQVNLTLASCAAPYYSDKSGYPFQGALRTDGYIGGVPIQNLIDRGFKDILVMLCYPIEEILLREDFSPTKKAWIKKHMRHYPTAIVDKVLDLNRTIRNSLRPIFENPHINFAIMAPERTYADMLTTDPGQLTLAGNEGRRVALQHLAAFAS